MRVVGVWTDGEIVDAVATGTDWPRVEYVRGLEGSITPAELGQTAFVELAESFAADSVAPVIASGGTRSSMWLHVLYVTAELAEAHDHLPIRTDVFASITPYRLE